ncbi:MAG TPA: hypothetical protein VN231_08080 [Allosphingosinicella sp.]|nr:hypothetical protein [Allosphingosinicella sp.]
MNEGPGAGNIIAGIFLILFGLCITLLGGGCTVLMMSELDSMMTSGGWPLMLISLVTLGGGLALIWLGVKLMTGGFQR